MNHKVGAVTRVGVADCSSCVTDSATCRTSCPAHCQERDREREHGLGSVRLLKFRTSGCFVVWLVRCVVVGCVCVCIGVCACMR